MHGGYVRLRERHAEMRGDLYRDVRVLHECGLQRRRDVRAFGRIVRVSRGDAPVWLALRRIDAVLRRRRLPFGDGVPFARIDLPVSTRELWRRVRIVRSGADVCEWSLRRMRRRRAAVLRGIVVFERCLQRRVVHCVRRTRSTVLRIVVHHGRVPRGSMRDVRRHVRNERRNVRRLSRCESVHGCVRLPGWNVTDRDTHRERLRGRGNPDRRDDRFLRRVELRGRRLRGCVPNR
jgi:hypothetical protein